MGSNPIVSKKLFFRFSIIFPAKERFKTLFTFRNYFRFGYFLVVIIIRAVFWNIILSNNEDTHAGENKKLLCSLKQFSEE